MAKLSAKRPPRWYWDCVIDDILNDLGLDDTYGDVDEQGEDVAAMNRADVRDAIHERWAALSNAERQHLTDEQARREVLVQQSITEDEEAERLANLTEEAYRTHCKAIGAPYVLESCGLCCGQGDVLVLYRAVAPDERLFAYDPVKGEVVPLDDPRAQPAR